MYGFLRDSGTENEQVDQCADEYIDQRAYFHAQASKSTFASLKISFLQHKR